MELSDFLGEELLAFCSNDTEVHGPGHEDEDLDTLFAFVFNDFESIPDSNPSNVIPATQSQTSYTPTHVSSSSGRLAPPKTEEVQEARNTGIPKKTIEDTQFCVKVWAEWCSYCREVCGHAIPTLESIESTQMQHWLTCFVLEVLKKNGAEYSPNTLHHPCTGKMRFFRWNSWSSVEFFADTEFINFYVVLDGEMKRLLAKGVGSKMKQAEPLSEQEEEILWEKGVLEDATPQTLMDTMVFMNGHYFALHSDSEYRALRFVPPQIEVVEREGERPYLLYTEDVSKKRPGGLKGRRLKSKVVRHHANTDNPERCFVWLFKLYTSMCPAKPLKMLSI